MCVHQVPVQISKLYALVVQSEGPDKYTHFFAGQPLRHDPGIFEGLPGDLQKQPLLRVHAGRLPWRDPEELRIETVDPRKKAAPKCGDLAWNTAVRIVERAHIPPVFRNFRGGIDAVLQQLKVGLRIRCGRKPASDPDNCDWLHCSPPPRCKSVEVFSYQRSRSAGGCRPRR